MATYSGPCRRSLSEPGTFSIRFAWQAGHGTTRGPSPYTTVLVGGVGLSGESVGEGGTGWRRSWSRGQDSEQEQTREEERGLRATCFCGSDCDCDRGCHYDCDCACGRRGLRGVCTGGGNRGAQEPERGGRTRSRSGRGSRSGGDGPPATAAATATATGTVVTTATASAIVVVRPRLAFRRGGVSSSFVAVLASLVPGLAPACNFSAWCNGPGETQQRCLSRGVSPSARVNGWC